MSSEVVEGRCVCAALESSAGSNKGGLAGVAALSEGWCGWGVMMICEGGNVRGIEGVHDGRG